jgi:hypothetical protein
MRFYICRQHPIVEGPFEVEQLRAMRARGELPATTQVCAEGTTAWQPLGAVETLLGSVHPPIDSAGAAVVLPGAWGDEPAGPLSIRRAFELAWECLKRHYGLFLGLTALFIVLEAVVQVLGLGSQALMNQGGPGAAAGLLMFLLQLGIALVVVYPFAMGINLIAAMAARGEAVSFGMTGAAFKRLGWLIVHYFFIVALAIAVAIPAVLLIAIVMGIMAAISNAGSGVSMVMAVVGICFAIVAAVILCVLAVRINPSFLLLIDPRYPGLNPITALATSWKGTRGMGITMLAISILMGIVLAISLVLLLLPFVFIGLPLAFAVSGAMYAILFRGAQR